MSISQLAQTSSSRETIQISLADVKAVERVNAYAALDWSELLLAKIRECDGFFFWASCRFEWVPTRELLGVALELSKEIKQSQQPYDVFCGTDDQLIVRLVACALARKTFIPVSEKQVENLDVGREWALASLNQQDRNESIPIAVFTSGTSTGIPKLVLLPSRILLTQIFEHWEVLGLQKSASRLCVLPKSHCFGLVLDLLIGLFSHQKIFCAPPDPRVLRQVLHSFSFEHIALVPRLIESLLGNFQSRLKIQKLHMKNCTLHVGGASLAPELRTELQSMFQKVIEGYGFTEAGPGVLIDGSPLSHLNLAIACSNCAAPEHTQKGNTRGVLCVQRSQLGVFCESSRESSSSISAEKPEFWFRTSDLCEVSNGKIRVLGRTGRVVKNKAGEWVVLDALASQLMRREKVPPFVILSVGDGLKIYWASAAAPSEIHTQKSVIQVIERQTGMAVVAQQVLCSTGNSSAFESIKLNQPGWKSMTDLLHAEVLRLSRLAEN